MHTIFYIAGLALSILPQSTLAPPRKHQNAPPPIVSLGKQLSLKIEGITPYTDFQVVHTKDTSFWAFAVTDYNEYAISGAYFDGSDWTPLKEITPSHKSVRFWGMTAAVDPATNPLVFWAARTDEDGNPCPYGDIRGTNR